MKFDKVINSLQIKLQPNQNKMADISVGRVVKIKPMEIKIDNNITLTDDFFSLSDLCKEYIIKNEEIELTNVEIQLPPISFISHGEEHTIKAQKVIAPTIKGKVSKLRLWENLAEGEQVNMIRANGGQMYFVVDRERI